MEFVTGTPQKLSSAVLAGMSKYRHRVFIEKLGWNLPCPEGQETDQFDHADTTYVVAHDDAGAVTGVARLLPTSRSYLLADVFPQLMGGVPLPCSDDVWELSRFAAVNLAGASGSNPMSQYSAPATIELMHHVIRVARTKGAKRLIAVTHLGVERLLRRAGFVAHRAAPPVMIDGQPLFACWIEVDESMRTVSAAKRLDS